MPERDYTVDCNTSVETSAELVESVPRKHRSAESKSRLTLSVVIPVYNERRTIAELLRRVQAVAINKEIIIVDDGSTDGSREFLMEFARACEFFKELREAFGKDDLGVAGDQSGHESYNKDIRIVFQEENGGKGAALRRGFLDARGEIVIVQDADLELDPQDYHKLLEPIERGAADVVYGSRFLGAVPTQRRSWHSLGNNFLTSFSNFFTGLELTDVWTCYKVFRRELLHEIEIAENRFGVEPELTAKIAKRRWRLSEVPISYHRRTYAEGKKIGWKDGIRALCCVIRYRFFD